MTNNITNLKPGISVYKQYINDLSFENLLTDDKFFTYNNITPYIDLSLDLHAEKMNSGKDSNDFFKVTITTTAKALYQSQHLFIIELKYTGIFQLINISKDEIKSTLAVTCPTILFPFVRKIIADATHYGGFQALMIDPVDFLSLYKKQMLKKDDIEN